MRGLPPVAASRVHSSLRCAGLSPSWSLPLRSTGSRRAGSVAVAHGPSCSAACGIFPDQELNPCPLHWQADSQPLRHQGSPSGHLLIPGNWVCYLTWQKGLCRCDKLRLLRRGDCPGLSGCAQCNHRGPYKWKREAGESDFEGNVMMEGESKWWDVSKTQPAIAALKLEGGHEPKNEAASGSWKDGKETDSLLEPPERSAALPPPRF